MVPAKVRKPTSSNLYKRKRGQEHRRAQFLPAERIRRVAGEIRDPVFPKINLFRNSTRYSGGWQKAQKAHFADWRRVSTRSNSEVNGQTELRRRTLTAADRGRGITWKGPEAVKSSRNGHVDGRALERAPSRGSPVAQCREHAAADRGVYATT